MTSFQLTRLAEADLIGIWEYPYHKWGKKKADRYIDILEAQCETLQNGHALIKFHDDVYPSLRSIRCEQHYIFFLHAENNPPAILAFLHERMDLITRLKQRL